QPHNASKELPMDDPRRTHSMILLFQTRFARILAILFVLAGCKPGGKSEPTESEQPLAAQVADVRSRKADQIQVEQVPLHDDDLRGLANQENLRVLLLDHLGNHFSAAGLQHLATLNKLQH